MAGVAPACLAVGAGVARACIGELQPTRLPLQKPSIQRVEESPRRPVYLQSTKSPRVFLNTSSNFSAVTFPTE